MLMKEEAGAICFIRRENVILSLNAKRTASYYHPLIVPVLQFLIVVTPPARLPDVVPTKTT